MSQEQEKKLARGPLESAEYNFPPLSYVLPHDHTLEDALRPEYWAPKAASLEGDVAIGGKTWAGLVIHVRREDHTMFAQLYIRAVRKAALDVALIGEPQYFGPREMPETDRYTTRWNVGAQGYDIIRKTDKQIVAHAKDLPKKEDALKWIADMAA